MAGYRVVRGAAIGDAAALQEYGKLWPAIGTRSYDRELSILEG